MRHLIFALLALTTVTNAANAGLYESGEPYEFVPNDGKVAAHSFDSFRIRLSDLRSIPVPSPQPSALRRKYLERRDELNAVRRRLNASELDVLGSCYYRLLDRDGALSAWLEASRKDPRNFAAYSNLALLHFDMGDLLNARRYQVDVQLPLVIPGMTEQQTAWFVKVEGYLRRLMKTRYDQGKGIAPEQLRPDDLFGVEFVGDDGYQAGHIAAAQKENVPEDAIAIVQQLLLWLPHDSRLQWLLAELYNANGDPGSALTLLRECIDPFRFRPALLDEHRRILEKHFEDLQAQDEQQRQQEEEHRRQKETQKRGSFWLVVLIGGVVVTGLVGWQLFILFRRVARHM